MFLGVYHTSFTVSNLERSIEFYRDVLELEFTHSQIGANEYTRKFIGFPDAILKSAQFKLKGIPAGPSGHVLELIEYVAPTGTTLDLRTCNIGVAHLCFYTDRLMEQYERLVHQGVKFRSEPVYITEGFNKGGCTCYFSDPDGITLELLQPPPGRL